MEAFEDADECRLDDDDEEDEGWLAELDDWLLRPEVEECIFNLELLLFAGGGGF